MIIIGLCGYAGSGKSTAAKYLEENYKFKRVNFKDGLVSFIKKGFPDVIAWCSNYYKMTEQELFDNKPELFRALMRNVGTDSIRNQIDNDFWVKIWVESIKDIKGNIVVDDVRFFNELSALTELDGVLIRITRPDITSAGSHASETEQTKFIQDFLIEGEPNSHTAIYKQLDEVINIIKSNHD